MKKIVLSLSLFIAAFLFFFQSCKKSNNAEQGKIDAYFTKMGIRHNKLLDYVAQNCDVNRSSAKERFEISKEYLQSNNNWNSIRKTLAITKQINHNTKPSDIFRSKNYDGINYSNEGIVLVDSLFSIVNNANYNITPDNFNSSIDNLINYIYNNYEVNVDVESENANEFGYIVAQCYQAKASYAYWYEAYTNPNHPWYDFVHADDQNRGFWRWLRAVGADIGGFFTSDCLCPPDEGFFICYNLSCAWNNAGEASAAVE